MNQYVSQKFHLANAVNSSNKVSPFAFNSKEHLSTDQSFKFSLNTAKHSFSCHKSVKFTLFIVISLQLIVHVNCQCTYTPVSERLFVSPSQSCTLQFNNCKNYSLAKCYRLKISTHQISSENCQNLCCVNSSRTENSAQALSLSFCQKKNSQTKINYFNLYYLAIGIPLLFVCGVCVFLLIAYLYKKMRTNTDQQQNNHTFNPSVPSLEAFNIKEEGPYFINNNDQCVICLENDVNLRTHCNHFYHGNCLQTWLKSKPNNSCPLCMSKYYNPIKVYCKSCHCGDILVNILPSTNLATLKQYSTHLCQNCKKAGDQSFVLDDSAQKDSKNNDKTAKNLQKDQKDQQKTKKIEQNKSKNQQNLNNKSRIPRKRYISEKNQEKPRQTQSSKIIHRQIDL